MKKKEIVKRLVAIGKMRVPAFTLSGHTQFMGCAVLNQENLIKVQSKLLTLIQELDYKEATTTFRYMYED